MRKYCRERFGSTQSVKLYDLWQTYTVESGQTYCLVSHGARAAVAMPGHVVYGLEGTAQDCVDHMSRAHDIPPLVKAANLARWFPPWTITREQWTSMTRPAVSGIAVDTLLFSRIGVPLFHRYRVVNRSGTHRAFRGAYMRRMHAFLEESDAASLRRRHHRCARDIAAWMSRTSLRRTGCKMFLLDPK